MTHTVRTTLRPDQDVEVGDAEYLDLKRDGLLVDAPETPAAPAPAPKKAATPATTKEG